MLVACAGSFLTSALNFPRARESNAGDSDAKYTVDLIFLDTNIVDFVTAVDTGATDVARPTGFLAVMNTVTYLPTSFETGW